MSKMLKTKPVLNARKKPQNSKEMVAKKTLGKKIKKSLATTNTISAVADKIRKVEVPSDMKTKLTKALQIKSVVKKIKTHSNTKSRLPKTVDNTKKFTPNELPIRKKSQPKKTRDVINLLSDAKTVTDTKIMKPKRNLKSIPKSTVKTLEKSLGSSVKLPAKSDKQ